MLRVLSTGLLDLTKFVLTNLNRHVILPKELLRQIPKCKLLSENEWRNIGVQQSRGWVHYAVHR